MAATLLPNGEQTFFDANGDPLAGGFVAFYVPNTSTFKDTWQDSAQTIPNSNPVILDAAGRAIIYGVGVYRQRIEDANNNLIWDQLTASVQFFITGTSATSLLIATGTKTFVTQTGLDFAAGQFVSAVSNANNANYMSGVVTSYSTSTGTLVLNVLAVGGSGTYSDWLLSLSGAVGSTGSAGSTGATGAAGQGVPTGGTAGQALTKIDGTNYNTQWTTIGGGGSGFTSVVAQVFTTTGTYTPTSGMEYCIIEMVGGAGGSGGIENVQHPPSGAGGGGEYAWGVFDAATIGASQVATIGAGGTAGTAAPTSGGNGGTTSIGALITAAGGIGGDAATGNATAIAIIAGAAGGTGGTGGSVRYAGEPGDYGAYYDTALWVSGKGGSSRWGMGGASKIKTSGAGGSQGTSGTGYGSAPSGSVGGNSGTVSASGLAGQPGLIVITEFCS